MRATDRYPQDAAGATPGGIGSFSNTPEVRPLMLEKSPALSLKFAPGDAGEIEGYASAFGGEPDRHGDIVQRGAYAKSLASGAKPLFLWSHDTSQPIGTWTDVREDETGLKVKGRLILETQRGAEAYALLRAGALDGLSIGYRATDFKERPGGGRLLTELELAEISLVTLPSNSRARVTSVKSGEITPRVIETILTDAGVSRAMAKGIVACGFRGATDDRREAASAQIKSITETLATATRRLKQ